MSNPATPSLSESAATELARRAAVNRSPERDPEGDCTQELAEAMALQDMCHAQLSALERLVDEADTPDVGKLKALYAALYAARREFTA